MEHIKRIKQGLLITAVAALVACGGGDSGSSGPTYTGKTAPAKITVENADEMLNASIDGASPGGQTASVTAGSDNPDQQKARLAGIAGRMKNLTQSASKKVDSNGTGSGTAAVVSKNETETGDCGGTATYSGSYDDVTYDINLSVRYNQYCDSLETEGAILSGSASATGAFNFDTGEFNFSMRFQNLTTVDESDSLSLNGSMSMSGNDTSFDVTMTFDFRDNYANKVYRVENYGATINEYGSYFDVNGYYTMDIHGKVYHPDHGSFIITTPDLVHVKFVDEYPYQGSIKIEGDNSSVTVVFNGDGTYTMDVDENGDGIPDATKFCNSATGECVDAAT